MRIKKSLTNVYDIFEYVYSFLKELGYEVYYSSSSISKSEYIEINNMSEVTKKDIDNIKIRISDHDLPITYFKQNPYDYDLKSLKDNRNGIDGDAITYVDFLEMIVDITPIKSKPKINKIKYPYWFVNYDKIYDLYKNLDSLKMFPFFLNGIIYQWLNEKKELKML